MPDELAVAHHRDAIAQRRDLVEAVRDVDERRAGGAALAHEREQALDLAVGERGGRLVEHDHARVIGERARDLEHLLHADAEVAGRRVEVDLRRIGAEHAAQRARARCASARPRSTRPNRDRLAAEHEVLGDRHLGDERQLLVHDRDAGSPRVARASGTPARAPPTTTSPVKLPARVDAAEDLDQRRLAGAVLADEPEHLARLDRERDVVQRAHAGELLADPAKLDDRGVIGASCGRPARADDASITRVARRARPPLARARDAGAAADRRRRCRCRHRRGQHRAGVGILAEILLAAVGVLVELDAIEHRQLVRAGAVADHRDRARVRADLTARRARVVELGQQVVVRRRLRR